MISRRFMLNAGALLAAPGGAKGASRETAHSASIYRSDSFELSSREGRSYVINVALPFVDDPTLELEIKGKKPIPIYATDSITNFGLVSSLTRLMQWGGELPPCLTVAVGYRDEGQALRDDVRRIDLTPTKRPHGKTIEPGDGGAKAFRKFLVDVLKPEIGRRYEIEPSQSVLMGHSYGGLFAIDTMVQEPSAFRNYLAISPSLWFDKDIVLNQLTEALHHGTKYSGRLAVFAGEREERIAGQAFHMTSNVLEVASLVSMHRASFGAALVKIIPDASHHTVLGPSVTQGLQFLLSPAARRAETY